MNSRGQIGQALTSFPSLIFVFVIMFLFVTIAVFIADSRDYEENMATDFTRKTIVLNDLPITIKEAFENNCKTWEGSVRLENNLKDALVGKFVELYGQEYSFVLVSHGKSVFGDWFNIVASYGVFSKQMKEIEEINKDIIDLQSKKVLRVSEEDFEKVFTPQPKNYDSTALCSWGLFIKKGSEL